MRIVNIMLGKGLGGIEAAFRDYAAALRARGHDVVCCLAPGAAIAAQLPADTPLFYLEHHWQSDPLAALRLRRMLADIAPDALIAHGNRAHRLALLAQCAKARRVPHIKVLHRHRFGGAEQADHVICVSRALQREALAHGVAAHLLSYIPNLLRERSAVEPAESWHAPPLVGVLGRLVEEKGVDLLLEAVALLKTRGVACRLRIAGSGPLESNLQARAQALGIAGQVDWLGWVDDVAEFFAGVDIVCAPSRRESFGIVIIEAFYHGKPVVAARASGPGEIIRHGENGWLCDISATALADGLQQLLADRELVRRLARQGQLDSRQYCFDTVAPQIEQCIRNVIAATAPRAVAS